MKSTSKFAAVSLILALIFSIQFSYAGQTTSSREEADKIILKRISTHVLLTGMKAHLENYYKNGDQKALALLLQPWSIEQRTLLKKDLSDTIENPNFVIHDMSLYIITKSGHTQFEVEDPSSGRFLINGQKIRIQTNMTYSSIKQKIAELKSDAQSLNHPFIELLLPNAQAIFPLAIPVVEGATLACVRFCGAIATATAGFVGRSAASIGPRLLTGLQGVTKWAAVGLTGGSFTARSRGRHRGRSCRADYCELVRAG